MPTVNLGRVGIVNKGAYVGGTTIYKVNDIVTYNSSVYICIQAHSAEHLPTDVLYWQVWMDTANYYVKSEVDGLIQTDVGAPIASASTTNVGGLTAGDIIHITGVTTITSLGVSVTGTIRDLVFDGVLTITHNGTSLILPNATNIVTAAGSAGKFVCENGALGYWRCVSFMHSAVSVAGMVYTSTLTSDAQTQLNLKVSKDSDTGAAVLPAGTTAQRPASPVNGYMRYNSDLLAMEAYVNGAWGSTGTPVEVVTHAATSKVTPVDADELGLVDSVASFGLKKITWGNIKTALASLFAPLASPAFTGTPTAPTAIAGTNTTQIATTAFVKAKSELDSIGVGQTWQDVGGSRVLGTTYTNSTGKPIQVHVTGYTSAGTIGFQINSVTYQSYTYTTNGYICFSVIVPPGATYGLTNPGGVSIHTWMELR